MNSTHFLSYSISLSTLRAAVHAASPATAQSSTSMFPPWSILVLECWTRGQSNNHIPNFPNRPRQRHHDPSGVTQLFLCSGHTFQVSSESSLYCICSLLSHPSMLVFELSFLWRNPTDLQPIASNSSAKRQSGSRSWPQCHPLGSKTTSTMPGPQR